MGLYGGETMKTCFAVVVLLGGMCWGQTTPPDCKSGEEPHYVIEMEAGKSTTTHWECQKKATLEVQPEPIDVRAIKDEIVCVGFSAKWCDETLPELPEKLSKYNIYISNKQVWVELVGWHCADKTRILQHDEDSPARWWCHRVQP
jgi:hypothetical protein